MDLFNSILDALNLELSREFNEVNRFGDSLYVHEGQNSCIYHLGVHPSIIKVPHSGETHLKIELGVGLIWNPITWKADLQEVSDRLYDISKKHSLSYYADHYISLADSLKSLKLKPARSNLEDIVYRISVASTSYTPIGIYDSKKHSTVDFAGVWNITNTTLQEISGGIAKEIWNFYTDIYSILTDQKFILNELINWLKSELTHNEV